MKATTGKKLAIAALVAGVIVVVAAFALPLVKMQQTLVAHGPATPYGSSGTTISGYFIPPVDKGQEVAVSLEDFAPGSLSISLFPSDPDALSPVGTPLVLQTGFSAGFTAVIASPATQAYGIFVSSSNRTSFTLTVVSAWSPFYSLRGYVAVGIFLVIAGAGGAFYFSQAEAREKMFAEAMDELKSRPSGGSRLSLAQLAQHEGQVEQREEHGQDLHPVDGE